LKTWQLVLNQALEQAGYTKDSELTLEDFGKVKFHSISETEEYKRDVLIKKFIAFWYPVQVTFSASQNS
jgi:hypothetical protein